MHLYGADYTHLPLHVPWSLRLRVVVVVVVVVVVMVVVVVAPVRS